MTISQAQKPQRATREKAPVGRLFLLDLSEGRILTVNPDGSDKKIIVTGCRLPDGIVVDAEAGHIYWTNMGALPVNDGSIERADLDGRNRKTIVHEGGTFTPKQMHLEKPSGKLYWCDREGMRVMRALSMAPTSRPSSTAVRETRGPVTIRQNGAWESPSMPIADRSTGRRKAPTKRVRAASSGRASKYPTGRVASNRTDIEVLFDGLPEPIDLELDHKNRVMYWTDRGDPPRGNTVNRAPMDSDAKSAPRSRDRVHSLDGRNWHRAGCRRRPNVHDRSGRFRLFRQAQWIEQEGPALRSRKPGRHRIF